MNSTFSEEQPRSTLETTDGTPRETEQEADLNTEDTSFEEEDDETFEDDELDEETDEDEAEAA